MAAEGIPYVRKMTAIQTAKCHSGVSDQTIRVPVEPCETNIATSWYSRQMLVGERWTARTWGKTNTRWAIEMSIASPRNAAHDSSTRRHSDLAGQSWPMPRRLCESRSNSGRGA
jgi:hypothetical protein